MATILSRLVERLDSNINRLRRAKKRLREKNLEDKLLDQQIKRLVSIRNRLRNRNLATGDGGINLEDTSTPRGESSSV